MFVQGTQDQGVQAGEYSNDAPRLREAPALPSRSDVQVARSGKHSAGMPIETARLLYVECRNAGTARWCGSDHDAEGVLALIKL